MVVYPIRVPRHRYRGNKPNMLRKAQRYNDIADMCEKYLNDKIKDNPADIQQYLYGYIASDLRLSVEEVREVLFGVDCGHNGLTVRKSATSDWP